MVSDSLNPYRGTDSSAAEEVVAAAMVSGSEEGTVSAGDSVGLKDSRDSSMCRSSMRPLTKRIIAARIQIPANINKIMESVFRFGFMCLLYAESAAGCNRLKQKDFLILEDFASGRYFLRKMHIKSYRIQ